ncbi:MAG TPA: nucleoside hydrolase [Bryobacteraceae bacterium]|nr:nucleoside hydrolase [Bryobacteraceae bacterium]
MRVLLNLFLSAALLLCGAHSWAQQPIPIIFDTDIGDDIDDALALALALQSPELDVRAVTTVSDDTEGRSRLAWKELGLYGRHDVALGTGAPEPLLDPMHTGRAPQFTVLTDADTLPSAAHRRASELIIETLMQSPRKITLVPVGPLTNIALALKGEPRIKDKIERIVLMGGAFNLLTAEYNIQRDRIAAEIVFSSGVPITAVGLDVTLQCKLGAPDMKRLRDADNPASRFLVRLIELWQNGHPDQFPILHDPLAVAVTLNPHLVETQLGSVHVETASPLTHGMTIFTPAERLAPDAHATTSVARQVDAHRFIEMFLGRLSSAPRGEPMRNGGDSPR